MKKTFKAVFVAIFVLSIAILTLGSCDSNAPDAASGEKECNHQWGEWETITEANCVNPGIAKRECSLCKENEEKDISATGQHKESDWIVDKEPIANLELLLCFNKARGVAVYLLHLFRVLLLSFLECADQLLIRN